MKAFNKRNRPKHTTKGKHNGLWFIQHYTKNKFHGKIFKWINPCKEWEEQKIHMLDSYKCEIYKNFLRSSGKS